MDMGVAASRDEPWIFAGKTAMGSGGKGDGNPRNQKGREDLTGLMLGRKTGVGCSGR